MAGRKTPLVRMEGVSKWFGSVQALSRVDFEVYEGEVVGLVGDNGAGKSTLIKILAGVYPQDEGRIYWDGKEVKIASVQDSRKLGIETVFQEQALVSCFSVAENVFLGREPVRELFAGLKVVDYKKMREEADKAIQRLGLRIDVRKEVGFCSGGQQQGVAIARAMYFKSRLVILDEPERGLSVAAKKVVQEFVRKLKAENIACIYITHDYHQVYPVADRIVLLSQGKKVLDIPKTDISIEDLEELILTQSAASKGDTL